MYTRTLVLEFLDSLNETRNIRIDNPKEELTQQEVEDAMNSIIANNIFVGTLVSATKAYIITTEIEEIYEQVV